MQFCQDHWRELKNAIRKRGLWAMVAAHVTGQAPQENEKSLAFDPLEIVCLLISDQAMMAFGDYLLTQRYCPLCEVEENLGRGQSFEWIETDANTVLAMWKQRKLILS